MDWFDFFLGMWVAVDICEAEYQDELRNYQNEFDEDAYEQYLFEQKFLRDKRKNSRFLY